MLSTQFHPKLDDIPVYNAAVIGPNTYYFVYWGGLTLHLYPDRLEIIKTFRDQLNQFIETQEAFNAQAPLSNGDRLDNSRNLPIVPSESLPPVHATLETHE